MNNEAYASQYIDHHIAIDPRLGPVVMSRQNLLQNGSYPWILHGCLDGATGFATDALQLFGPQYRDAANIPMTSAPTCRTGDCSMRSPAPRSSPAAPS